MVVWATKIEYLSLIIHENEYGCSAYREGVMFNLWSSTLGYRVERGGHQLFKFYDHFLITGQIA